MRTIEALAADMVKSALPAMDAVSQRILKGDLAAGEYEVAAISAVEAAPRLLAATDLVEFEVLSRQFDEPDRTVATKVIERTNLRSA